MALAGGIDLGGTKIEARLFNTEEGWRTVDFREVPTPRTDYRQMLAALVGSVNWLDDKGARAVGLGAPGLISPKGIALTANLPANAMPLRADLEAALKRPLPIINDCRAFTLSEARFGAGQGAASVLGIVIGTGLAGGFVMNGKVLDGPNGQAGEFGHMPMPFDVVTRHDLPWLSCGCGRTGCYETICSGTGLTRLAELKTGRKISPADLPDEASEVLAIWSEMMGCLLSSTILTLDPEVIVLGGGVSKMPGITKRLASSLNGELLAGTHAPPILRAEGGDRSGARGAALFAFEQEAGG